MGREEDLEDLGTRQWSVALPVPATLSLRGTGESGQAWRAAGMQNQSERVEQERMFWQENGEERTCMQQKWGERGRAGSPASVLPSPSQETNPDPRPLLPWEYSMASAFPLPSLPE